MTRPSRSRSGGGMITAVMNGHQKLLSIKIAKEAVDPEDVEMLQDMIVAAINEAIERSQGLAADRMSALTGGPEYPWTDVTGSLAVGSTIMPQMLARPVADLIEVLSRLPGIGPKTASRLTFYLLRSQDGLAEALAEALQALRSGTVLCERCYNIAEHSPCAICADAGRDQGTICVVEEPLDVLAIERTGEYRGRLSRAARRALADRRHLSGEAAHRRAGRPRARPPAARGDPGHQPEPRGREHGRLHLPAAWRHWA